MSEAYFVLLKMIKVINNDKLPEKATLSILKSLGTTFERKLHEKWEKDMRQEIAKAVIKHNIDPEVLKEARRLLSEGIRFDLLYNNSREQYFGIKLKDQI